MSEEDQLPRGWCFTTLGELAESCLNGFGKRSQEAGVPTVVLRLADVQQGMISVAVPRRVNALKEEIEKYRLRHDDLIAIRVNGSPNLVGRLIRFNGAEESILYCDHFIRLRLIERSLSRFLRYYGDTHTARRYIDEHKVSTAGQNTISQGTLEELGVPLPPLREQQRIADVIDELLSDLDAGVAALERVQRKLALYRASVLKAAVEGRLIPTSAQYKWQPIGAVIENLDQGWSPRCESDPSDDAEVWAVMKTTAVQPLHFLEMQNKRLPKTLMPRPHLQLVAGDLLVTRAGPRSRVGVACAVRSARSHIMLCDKVYRIRCKPDKAIPTFLEVVLNAPQIVDALDTLKTGISDSGVNLTQARFRELLVPLPRLSEQEAIVEAVEDQLSVIDHIEADLETKLKTAQALRQSILRHAFTGQLVPQDPNDEPASELLKRIAAEREERAREAFAAKHATAIPKGRRKNVAQRAQKRDC